MKCRTKGLGLGKYPGLQGSASLSGTLYPRHRQFHALLACLPPPRVLPHPRTLPVSVTTAWGKLFTCGPSPKTHNLRKPVQGGGCLAWAPLFWSIEKRGQRGALWGEELPEGGGGGAEGYVLRGPIHKTLVVQFGLSGHINSKKKCDLMCPLPLRTPPRTF